MAVRRCARRAAYAGERIVFGRPIGQNQAIQHPLAKCWMELEAANLMAFKAASLYDLGAPCAAEANAAKYLGAEAGFSACEAAVMTHGGMGYAKEFHVERYLREVMIARLAPVCTADDPVLHRREGARPAEVVLSGTAHSHDVIPGREQRERTRNPDRHSDAAVLVLDSGSGATRRPGMTE